MIVSIGYTLFFDGNIRELTMMYNEKRELEAAHLHHQVNFGLK